MINLKNSLGPLKNKLVPEAKTKDFIGKLLSFESREAYNLLRTNLLLSFPSDTPSHVMGVTSAYRGDGKSITSLNIAYSFGAVGKKVLLIECDLRLPTLAKNLELPKGKGISNYLVGQCELKDIIQTTSFNENIHVITSGTIPPNPSELLSSNKMKQMVEELRGMYEFIILDLPPVEAVSDALIVSPITDGMLVVVRQNYTETTGLAKTMRQFEYANVKVLGFVFNDYIETSSKYYKKYERKYKKYRRYYKYYKKS